MKEEKQREISSKQLIEQRGISILKNRLGVKGTEPTCYSKTFHLKDEDDPPINYSLKYSEAKLFNERHRSSKGLKEKEGMYADYVETDLDQPTDFSLKYGEDTKESGYDSGQPELEDATKAYFMEGTPYEGTPYSYSLSDLRISQSEIREKNEVNYEDEKGEAGKNPCVDITPLMFSRSSSINSLNSFEDLHHSIPDDRSSIVSDFSRMTSGVISPSELPDSPTQTVPPSPNNSKFSDVDCSKKKTKSVDCLSLNNLGSSDQSFKQDVSRKINSSSSGISTCNSKGNDLKQITLREQQAPDKSDLAKEKVELQSITDIEDNILQDCINTGIREYSRRPRTRHATHYEKKRLDFRISSGGSDYRHFSELKTNDKQSYQNETRKNYSPYDESDDAIHTYYTEGTPANISHAGSHSDLNIIVDGLMLRAKAEDTSDDGSYCSGETENLLAQCIQSGMPKAKHKKEKFKSTNINSMENNKFKTYVGKSHVSHCSVNRNCHDYLKRKDIHLTAKDEISTFATENSPCNFSVRSSLSDLTVNSIDSPGYLSRSDGNQISQSMPYTHSTVDDDKAQTSSNIRHLNLSKIQENYYWEDRKMEKKSSDDEYSDNSISRHGSLSSLSVKSFDSSELTPLEQALLEQCINSGMPHKNGLRETRNFSELQDGSDEVDGHQGESLYCGGEGWSEDYI